MSIWAPLTKVLILDAEIQKAIPSPTEENVSGIQYCEGWRDFAHMGISVIGGWEAPSNRYRVFDAKNPSIIQERIDEAEYIITFNGLSFDAPLLYENRIYIPREKHVDLLVQIWAAHRLGPEFQRETHLGFSLDACAKANGLGGKTGHGALAPVLWQQGRYAQVVDYCLQDIRLTRGILIQMLRGEFISPREKGVVSVVLPPMAIPV